MSLQLYKNLIKFTCKLGYAKAMHEETEDEICNAKHDSNFEQPT